MFLLRSTCKIEKCFLSLTHLLKKLFQKFLGQIRTSKYSIMKQKSRSD